jgi:O-antigen ligase
MAPQVASERPPVTALRQSARQAVPSVIPHLSALAASVCAMCLVAAGVAGHRRTSQALGALIVLLLATFLVTATAGDGTTILILSTSLLLLLPSSQIFAPLGGAGTPAAILALFGGWLWAVGICVRSPGSACGPQPIRYAALCFLAAIVASFVAASLRGLDPLEARAADRGLVVAVTAVAYALLAADTIRSRERLTALVRALVVGGCGLAVIGILQFTLSLDVTTILRVPGLSVEDSKYEAITSRSEFNRVAGTTFHPIEFSAVLTRLIPLALHLTYAAPPGRRRRWWVATGIIAAAIPMSVSRTGTVGVVAVALILFPSWTGRRRRQAIWATLLFAIGMKAFIPGLLGTLRALFFSFGVDPSVTARRIDYGFVVSFISERPWFGRGFGTFLPARYDFLDNQFLLSLVETGVVGLLATIALFAVGMGCARGLRRRSDDPVTRDLAISLFAGVVVALITFATFDFLSFPTARSVAFILLGCIGALWRLERLASPEHSRTGLSGVTA